VRGLSGPAAAHKLPGRVQLPMSRGPALLRLLFVAAGLGTCVSQIRLQLPIQLPIQSMNNGIDTIDGDEIKQ